MNQIKKAVFPIAGLGTRFLPLSKIVRKELLPLVDKPMIQYLIEEALNSGIKEIILVVKPGRKDVIEYFKRDKKLEKIINQRKRNHLLEEIKKLEEIAKKISFKVVYQKEPLGDGHAVLQAKRLVKKEPFAVFFGDDIIDSDIPAALQLKKIFATSQRPILSLAKKPKDEISKYGVVAVEKIASSIFKVKDIIEKPELEKAPSDLAIIGRYIFTPDIFDYLEKIKPNDKGEIILADALREMVRDGKIVYGYQVKGKWLECGEKLSWIKSNVYLSLKHPDFGEEIKSFIKKIL